MRARTTVLTAGAIFYCGSFLQAEPPILTGKQADLSRLKFEGVSAKEEVGIRWHIDFSLPLTRLLHPEASYLDLQTQLTKIVRAFYLWDGFHDAQVDANWNDEEECIVIRIQPGPQYTWNQLRILNAPPEVEAAIRHKLSEKTDSDPEWTAGKVADCTFENQSALRSGVAAVFPELGYEQSRFSIETEVTAPGQLDLVVDVSSVGQPVTFDEIQVSGSRRQSAAAILELVGLKKPERLSAPQI